MQDLGKFICLIVLVVGCNSRNQNHLGQELRADSPILKINVGSLGESSHLISPRELFREVEYITLKSPDSLQLTVIQKILDFGDMLLVLDRNKQMLFAYGLSGEFIGQVGKKGEGPEEFREVSDFDVDYVNHQIILYSRADRAIFWFDEQLGLIGRRRIEAWGDQISVLESGNLALYSLMDNKDDSYNIRVFDKNGNLKSKHMPYPQEDTQFAPSDFSGFISGNLFSYPYSSVVYEIDDDNSMDVPFAEIEFPDKFEEKYRFDHTKFLMGKFSKQILGDFEFGKSKSEALFFYSAKTNLGFIFTLGVALSGGQVFGHHQLNHSVRGKIDIYTMMFFRGPYGLPSYSKESGFFYVARNLESVSFFHKEIQERREELVETDPALYHLIGKTEDIEDPVIMKFKLVDRYEQRNDN